MLRKLRPKQWPETAAQQLMRERYGVEKAAIVHPHDKMQASHVVYMGWVLRLRAWPKDN
jgi:hypothetical protein